MDNEELAIRLVAAQIENEELRVLIKELTDERDRLCGNKKAPVWEPGRDGRSRSR